MNTHHARRRTVLTSAVGLVAAAVLAACGGSSTGNESAIKDDGSVDLSKVTLIVGDQKGTSAKALLEAAGLDDTDYTIEWKEFTSGPPMLEGLNANAIHVGMVGNTPPIFAAAAKGEFKMVQAITYTGKGDAILVPADSPLKSVADLKGKKVGVAEGSSANYNLLAQLDKAGLKYSDVSVENLQPADGLAAFTSGHLDAWAVWDPFTSQAVESGDARVLADGADVVNGYNFQVASDAALDDKATKAALQDYLGRITQAQLWASTHQDEWSKVWAEQTGLTPDVTLAAAKQRPVTVVPISQEVIDSEQEMADAFSENKLLPGEVNVSDYFDDEFNDYITEQADKASQAGS
ncbi:ABC transporter substrate-binding protein [Nocardioides sp. KIGAM211]|uniref:Putative aliphatic sulfonates-binding protein n=1 Tax=Nocardioides luti TaxID=2761101 RepID=A0A7X0RJI5_9ACTN|nr:ABC transporter substrate-binding protein [Nocardioides luti]MBB6629437.1 ABC transporter substrate-binding protein [Nocardioides luti]